MLVLIAATALNLSTARQTFYANLWLMSPAQFATATAGLSAAHFTKLTDLLTTNGVSTRYQPGEPCFRNAAGQVVRNAAGWTVIQNGPHTIPTALGELPGWLDCNDTCSNATSPGYGPGQLPPSAAYLAAAAKYAATHPAAQPVSAALVRVASLAPVLSAQRFVSRAPIDSLVGKALHWLRL